jgi:hypothetical protein
MQTDAGRHPPNLLADYLYLRQTAVVKQAVETARTSVSLGGHSSSYLCQQDSVFAAQDTPMAEYALREIFNGLRDHFRCTDRRGARRRGADQNEPHPAFRPGVFRQQQPKEPSARAGPMVRIRFAPAGSRLRTRLITEGARDVTTFTVASNAATIFSGLPSLLIGEETGSRSGLYGRTGPHRVSPSRLRLLSRAYETAPRS